MLPRYHSGKEFTSNAGDEGSLSGSGRSPGEGLSNPLQYSCLVDYSPWNCRVRLQQQRRYICITQSICHHLKRCKPTIKDGKTYIRNSLNKTLQDSNDLEIVWRPVCEFWQKCRSTNWVCSQCLVGLPSGYPPRVWAVVRRKHVALGWVVENGSIIPSSLASLPPPPSPWAFHTPQRSWSKSLKPSHRPVSFPLPPEHASLQWTFQGI